MTTGVLHAIWRTFLDFFRGPKSRWTRKKQKWSRYPEDDYDNNEKGKNETSEKQKEGKKRENEKSRKKTKYEERALIENLSVSHFFIGLRA